MTTSSSATRRTPPSSHSGCSDALKYAPDNQDPETGKSAPHPVPEILHLREEILIGGAVIAALLLEVAEELLLFARQVHRCLDGELDIEVTHLPAPLEHRHALSTEPQLLARLHAGWDFHARAPAIECRRLDFTAKRSGGHRHRD